jgi:four helix bundle protein
MIQSYRDLVAWQKGMELVLKIYQVSKQFPKEEIFTLTSQIRRAAISIPSNIAEGHTKSSSKEYRLFLGHAKGSLAEVETQIQIAHGLKYLEDSSAATILSLCAELGRIINGLIFSLKNK